MDTALISTFIRLKREGCVPPRDLILALTPDEENGTANGVAWLVKNHRDLIDAELVLNVDQGGVTTDKGKATSVEVAAAEKLYADFHLMVTNPGGHSSRPVPENAIYRLAHALLRIENSSFLFELNPVTKAFFSGVLRPKKRRNVAGRFRPSCNHHPPPPWPLSQATPASTASPTPPASPRASTRATPTMRCPSVPSHSSIADSSPAIRPKKSVRNCYRSLLIQTLRFAG